jgi:REP element-mobilizing transposase RayT
MGGSAIAIGGVNDHVHILLTLPKTLSMSEMVKTIKARSSTWIGTRRNTTEYTLLKRNI